MSDQATMTNGRVDHEAPTVAVARGVGELGTDILQLAELQAQLAKEDLAVALREIAKPIILISSCGVLALASLPVMLIALGELISQHLGISRGWSFLLVSLLVLTLSSIAIFLIARRMFQGFRIFARSRQELANNLQWLKSIWKLPTRQTAQNPTCDANRGR